MFYSDINSIYSSQGLMRDSLSLTKIRNVHLKAQIDEFFYGNLRIEMVYIIQFTVMHLNSNKTI